MKISIIGLAVLVVLLPATRRPASAQRETGSAASPFLPHHHWSVTAAKRLHGAALTPDGFDPSSGVLTVARMRDALAHAAARAAGKPLGASADAYLRRFDDEYRRLTQNAEHDRPALHAELGAGLQWRDGALHVGAWDTARLTWSDPIPLRNTSDAMMRGTLDVAYRNFAVTTDIRAGRNLTVPVATLTAVTHGVGFFGGRATPGYQTMETGSIVLQGDVPFNGGGVFLTQPLMLPGFLRHIGPIGFESMLAPAQRMPTVDHPWFWTARASFQPASWVGFNVTRAAYAGSLVHGESIGITEVFKLLVGQNSGEGNLNPTYADNQVVAIDGWFRSPIERVPVLFYWDWGADDSAGAWTEVAGHTFGLRLAAVPGLPELGVGLERIAIDKYDEDHGPWYRHTLMWEGWAEDGQLLGHPIGGTGRAVALYATADLFDAALRLHATAFTGTRGLSNVFAPTHAGRMHGFSVNAVHSITDRLDVSLRADRESGKTWSRSTGELQAAVRF